MKNTFKFAAIAVAAMAFAVACNNAPEAAEETVIDTPAIETVAEEMPVEDTVAVVEETPAAKPAAKKTTQKTTPNDASKVTISTDNGSASFTVNKSETKSNNTEKNDASKVTINTDNGSSSLTIKKN